MVVGSALPRVLFDVTDNAETQLRIFVEDLWPAPGSTDTELGVMLEPEVVMERRRHGREFKLEAVRLVKERGVSVAQAARDLECMPTCCTSGSRALRPIRSMPSRHRVR